MLRETLYYDKFNKPCQTSRFINKPNYVENIISPPPQEVFQPIARGDEDKNLNEKHPSQRH